MSVVEGVRHDVLSLRNVSSLSRIMVGALMCLFIILFILMFILLCIVVQLKCATKGFN